MFNNNNNNKETTMQNEHIKVAKAIRSLAKSLNLKVSVRSKVFAGGNSVDVIVKSGTKKSIEWFKKVSKQYSYNNGKFDHVDDRAILEVKNHLPQVSFLRVSGQ